MIPLPDINAAGNGAPDSQGGTGREASGALSGKQEPCCDEVRSDRSEDNDEREQQGVGEVASGTSRPGVTVAVRCLQTFDVSLWGSMLEGHYAKGGLVRRAVLFTKYTRALVLQVGTAPNFFLWR